MNWFICILTRSLTGSSVQLDVPATPDISGEGRGGVGEGQDSEEELSSAASFLIRYTRRRVCSEERVRGGVGARTVLKLVYREYARS